MVVAVLDVIKMHLGFIFNVTVGVKTMLTYVVYCNYKETNSSYNVIAKRNSPQTLLIVSNIFKRLV